MLARFLTPLAATVLWSAASCAADRRIAVPGQSELDALAVRRLVISPNCDGAPTAELRFGSAIVIAPGTLLTCLHLTGDSPCFINGTRLNPQVETLARGKSSDRDFPPAQVALDLGADTERLRQFVRRAEEDWIVLSTAIPSENEPTASLLSSNTDIRGHRLFVVGYEQTLESAGAHSSTRTALPARFSEPPTEFGSMPDELFVVTLDTPTKSIAGMSGGAIASRDPESGDLAVAGLIVLSYVRKDALGRLHTYVVGRRVPDQYLP